MKECVVPIFKDYILITMNIISGYAKIWEFIGMLIGMTIAVIIVYKFVMTVNE